MNGLTTAVNHEREPHCCGCWHIQVDGYIGEQTLIAVCNECGETRDLVKLLATDGISA